MDVRKKLVELLLQEDEVCEPSECKDCGANGSCGYYRAADRLIANGVTVQENVEISDELLKQLKSAPITICKEEPSIELVQEWISVNDRLPKIPEGYAESPEPVLYMMKNTKTIYAGYYGEGGVWKDKYFRQYADGSNGVDADDVLCWMYQHDLSQPQKGE